MKRNRQDSAETEVRVLNIISVNLFVLIQQVGVLELLDGLVSDLADPVVDPQPSILKNYLLQIAELVTLVVVSLEIFQQLDHMVFRVHDFGWLLEVESLDHHLGCASLLHNEEIKDVVSVDFADDLIDLDVLIQVLGSTSAGQVHKAVAMSLALWAEVVKDNVNVLLLQESLRSFHELPGSGDGLIGASHTEIL